MEIWNHICFRNDSHPLIYQYIKETEIECDEEDGTCTIDISESDPRWEKLSDLMKIDKTFCLSETKFSKEELSSAEWLTVRSKWYYDYPQPETGYKEITYTKENLCSCSDCGIALCQKDLFRFKRTPKWGKRNFCMTNWVFDELFVSPKAKEALESGDLQGFSFLNVRNKSGKEILNDVYQLCIPYVLPSGIADFTSRIDEVFICPVCRKQKLRPNGRGQFVFYRKAFTDAPDFVKSSEWFGGGAGASREILVSQRAYHFIKENKLDSSLVFEPVMLV